MTISSVSPSTDSTKPGGPAQVRFRWRILVLTALFFCLLLPRINSGTLWHHDELLTANRAREILVRRDPLTITLNYEPNFLKPPLQYWESAAALALWPADPELALRLPALLSGVGCLLALGWLARCGYPGDDPLVGLSAVLALAGCGYFLHFSRLALLDTGAALHVTLAMAGCQLARRDARWWWFVALVTVLGAWQKAPFALAAWVVVLLVRRFSHPKSGWLERHLVGALTVAAVGCAGWWLWQAAWHGLDGVLGAGHAQAQTLARAHDPGDRGFRPFLYWLWLVRDWALIGLCAPVIVCMELGWRTRQENIGAAGPSIDAGAGSPTLELAWVCALYGCVLALVPFRSERYVVVVTPLLALLTLRWFFLRVPAARRWLLAVLLLTTLPGASRHYLGLVHANYDLRAAAHDLGAALRPDETPVVCAEADPAFNVSAFVLFYADLPRPLRELDVAHLNTLPSPVRGICHRRQWAAYHRGSPASRQTSAHGDWIVWERH